VEQEKEGGERIALAGCFAGSTASGPGCECWDIKLSFRDPAGRHERVRKVYRYTVDVNDSIPCLLGGLHTRFEF